MDDSQGTPLSHHRLRVRFLRLDCVGIGAVMFAFEDSCLFASIDDIDHSIRRLYEQWLSLAQARRPRPTALKPAEAVVNRCLRVVSSNGGHGRWCCRHVTTSQRM